MVAELRDHDPGDELLGGQSAGDDMFGRMGLCHALRAAPTGILGPPRHQHPELGRNHVQPFGYILPDPGHLAAAARTLRAGRLDHPLDARQVRRQAPTVARGLARFIRTLGSPQRRLGLLLCRLEHAMRQFDIFQRQIELVG